MKIAWDLNEESLRSIQREHDMYMQRVWGLCEKIMRCKWREHKIYIKRSWDLHEDSIGLLEDRLGST